MTNRPCNKGIYPFGRTDRVIEYEQRYGRADWHHYWRKLGRFDIVFVRHVGQDATNTKQQEAVSVGWLGGWSFGNAFVRRTTRRSYWPTWSHYIPTWWWNTADVKTSKITEERMNFSILIFSFGVTADHEIRDMMRNDEVWFNKSCNKSNSYWMIK